MEDVQAIERPGEGPGFLLWAVREELGEIYQWFSSCEWPLCVSLGSRPSGELVK